MNKTLAVKIYGPEISDALKSSKKRCEKKSDHPVKNKNLGTVTQ